jgi:hypothetical protein
MSSDCLLCCQRKDLSSSHSGRDFGDGWAFYAVPPGRFFVTTFAESASQRCSDLRQAVKGPLCGPLANACLPADRAPGIPLGTQGGDSGGIHGDSRPSPSLLPLALAFLMPARTRSAIRLRSGSATAPSTVKTIFPVGVLVSTCSERETKSIPSALKVSRARSK